VSMKRITAAIAFAASTLPAQQAVACAVCFSGRDESRVAYLATAIFMTVIPIATLAIGIYWVVKKATAANAAPRR